MVRPKAGTKEGDAASERWRQTMINKYGVDGVHKKIYKGGFGGDRELAKRAGRKGGRISRRKGKYTAILDENKEFIRESIKNKATIQSIADELGIPHKSVRWYIQSRFGGLKNV